MNEDYDYETNLRLAVAEIAMAAHGTGADVIDLAERLLAFVRPEPAQLAQGEVRREDH